MAKTRDLIWVHKFEQVQIFREIFGHCIIPQRYHNDPSLGSWITKQRFFSKHLGINLGRKILLKKLEFTCSSPKNFYFLALWNKHYLELCYYRKIYGHCNVPSNFPENLPLGFWVKNQRQLLKKNKLDFHRVKLLFQIGFEGGRRKNFLRAPWKKRFYDLFCYYKINGNIKIAQRQSSLGKWIQQQRDFLKKNQKKIKKSCLLVAVDLNGENKGACNFKNFFTAMDVLKVQSFLDTNQKIVL